MKMVNTLFLILIIMFANFSTSSTSVLKAHSHSISFNIDQEDLGVALIQLKENQHGNKNRSKNELKNQLRKGKAKKMKEL